MQKRRLGRTGLLVPQICLGTMTWGEQNTESEGHAQMDFAVERGVNFLDAAELYPIPPKPETQGRTEEIIGNWMKARGNRSDIIVASKVVGRTAMDWFRDGRPAHVTRKDVNFAIERSLKRLQTDYIDLYQLHFPERIVPWGSNPTRAGKWPMERAADETPIGEIVAIFDDLVKAGKIRHYGLSNESSWGVMRFIAESDMQNAARIVSLQNAYNLVNRTFEVNLAEVCDREEVGLLAYSPLAQGYLTGKYQNGALPKGSRKQLYNRLQRYENPGAQAAFDAYLGLAAQVGLDPAQMALAFVLSRPFVTAAIVGASTLDQLKTNIDAIDLTLTEELEQQINNIHLLHQNPCP